MPRYVSKRCSTGQLAQESYGWAAAGVLASALSGRAEGSRSSNTDLTTRAEAWDAKGDYQHAMNTYKGKDSADGGYFVSYTARIENARDQNWKIHSGSQPVLHLCVGLSSCGSRPLG